ncbi:uncharacterized protein LOC134837478 [Culicoides brevitarsis]|uniref:uncharacterized protein LOC134837478 n=1 Tax=Culicoides brevitarsis TaxID=469753 RepID=UPI00307C648A
MTFMRLKDHGGSLRFVDRQHLIFLSNTNTYQIRERMRIKQVREQSNLLATCIRKQYDDEKERQKKYVKQYKFKEMKLWQEEKDEKCENLIKMSYQKTSINEGIETKKDVSKLLCIRSKSNQHKHFKQRDVANLAIENGLTVEKNGKTKINIEAADSRYEGKPLIIPFNEVSDFISTKKLMLENYRFVKDHDNVIYDNRSLIDKENLQHLVKYLNSEVKTDQTKKKSLEINVKTDESKSGYIAEIQKMNAAFNKSNREGIRFTKNNKPDSEDVDKLLKNVQSSKKQISEAFKLILDINQFSPKNYSTMVKSKQSNAKNNDSKTQLFLKTVVDYQNKNQEFENTKEREIKNKSVHLKYILNTSIENSISSKSTTYRYPMKQMRASEEYEKKILDVYVELTENCSKRIIELANIVKNDYDPNENESSEKAIVEKSKIYKNIKQVEVLGKSLDSGMLSESRPSTNDQIKEERRQRKNDDVTKHFDPNINKKSEVNDSFLKKDIYEGLNRELKRRKIKIDRTGDSKLNWVVSTLLRTEHAEKSSSSSSEITIKNSVGLKELLTKQSIFETHDKSLLSTNKHLKELFGISKTRSSTSSSNKINFDKKFTRTSTPLQQMSTTSIDYQIEKEKTNVFIQNYEKLHNPSIVKCEMFFSGSD